MNECLAGKVERDRSVVTANNFRPAGIPLSRIEVEIEAVEGRVDALVRFAIVRNPNGGGRWDRFSEKNAG